MALLHWYLTIGEATVSGRFLRVDITGFLCTFSALLSNGYGLLIGLVTLTPADAK